MREYPRSVQISKVDQHDPRVEKAKTDSHSDAEKSQQVFGEYAVRQYDEWQGYLEKLHDGRQQPWTEEVILQRRDEHLELNQKTFSQILSGQDSVGKLLFTEMLYKYIRSPNYKKEILNYFSVQNGQAHIAVDTMPKELFLDVLRFHSKYMEEERKKFEKQCEVWKQEFIATCIQGIRDGWLPLSEETVRERVQETKIMLRDSASYLHSFGDWNRWVSTVDTWQDDESKRETVFHELTHAIAARNLIEREDITHTDEFGDILKKKIDFQRSGLRFRYGYQKGIEKPFIIEEFTRFRWLNEGMTERIRLRLLQQADSEFYQDERAAIQKMIDAGIDEQLLIDAYFEDYDMKVDRMNRVPALRKLIKAIYGNPTLGKGYLMAIENQLK